MIFKFFSKNLERKNQIFFKKPRKKKPDLTSLSQPFTGVLSGYIQKLQIKIPTMTAQIILVSYDFFMFLFSKKLRYKKNWILKTNRA